MTYDKNHGLERVYCDKKSLQLMANIVPSRTYHSINSLK